MVSGSQLLWRGMEADADASRCVCRIDEEKATAGRASLKAQVSLLLFPSSSPGLAHTNSLLYSQLQNM